LRKVKAALSDVHRRNPPLVVPQLPVDMLLRGKLLATSPCSVALISYRRPSVS
jgi:hypothetical protein